MSGNASEIGDVGGSPGKSSLFFLTARQTLESDYPEIGFAGWESSLIFELSGALPTTRENPVA
jgi:hypothetical protein